MRHTTSDLNISEQLLPELQGFLWQIFRILPHRLTHFDSSARVSVHHFACMQYITIFHRGLCHLVLLFESNEPGRLNLKIGLRVEGTPPASWVLRLHNGFFLQALTFPAGIASLCKWNADRFVRITTNYRVYMYMYVCANNKKWVKLGPWCHGMTS